jgi:hypothetical protein
LLRNADRARHPSQADLNIPEEYRTTFYSVETPAGSLNGTMAYALNFTCPQGDVRDRAFLSVWKKNDAGGYQRYDSQTNFIRNPQQDAFGDCTKVDPNNPSVAFVQPLVNGQPLRTLPFDEFVVALGL